MKQIKLMLYHLLGLKKYLQLVSRIYIILIDKGFLKKQYPEIHFLKKMIKSGDTCVDIGANLGYYSIVMSKLAGKAGRVYAVEPVDLFCNIWKKNVKKSHFDNLTLLPYALGAENKQVQMGMPTVEDTVHHGMTKIIGNKKGEYERTFDVEMKVPDELFKDIEHIDFLKIDVEGYESVVLENMQQVLMKHHPVIQGEMSGEENKKCCLQILLGMSYEIYVVKDQLVEITEEQAMQASQDLYFIKRS